MILLLSTAKEDWTESKENCDICFQKPLWIPIAIYTNYTKSAKKDLVDSKQLKHMDMYYM